MKNVLCMSWNPDKSEKKTLPFLCFMAFYYLFKVKVFCVSTQQILGEIKCPFFSFCLLFSTIASGIFKPKNPAYDLSALIVLQWGFREIISTLRHNADVPVMTCQQKGVCFSFASSLFLIPYRISFPSTHLSFTWVWCSLVGVEGQEQFLQHVHCEATRALRGIPCCAWPWHSSTQVLWLRTVARISGTAMDTQMSGCVYVSCLRKPSHHSYLSKTAAVLASRPSNEALSMRLFICQLPGWKRLITTQLLKHIYLSKILLMKIFR